MSDIANLNNAASAINFYSGAIMAPFGMLCNCIVILVYMRPGLRKNSNTNISVFYTTLAIYDILALSNSIFFIQLLPSLNIRITNMSDALCKISWIWRRILIFAPSWTQMLITFDRFRFIVMPNRFKFYTNRKILKRILVSIFFIFLLIDMHGFGYYAIEKPVSVNVFNETLNRTVTMTVMNYICTSSFAMSWVGDIINVLFRAYIPFPIMLFMNIILTRRFIQSKKQTANPGRSMSKENSFTRTVIFMDMTFFTLYTPWCIWFIVNRVVVSTPSYQSPILSAYLNLFMSITYDLAYFNNFSSLFINLAFNNLFQKEVMNMLPFLKKFTGKVDTLSKVNTGSTQK